MNFYFFDLTKEKNAFNLKKRPYCDLKVASSHLKFDESFANYFFKTQVCCKFLKCLELATQK